MFTFCIFFSSLKNVTVIAGGRAQLLSFCGSLSPRMLYWAPAGDYYLAPFYATFLDGITNLIIKCIVTDKEQNTLDGIQEHKGIFHSNMKINKETQQKRHTQQWKQSEKSFKSFPGGLKRVFVSNFSKLTRRTTTKTTRFAKRMTRTGPVNFQTLPLSQHLK